jgi:sugar phosphate isomerase/epimerase
MKLGISTYAYTWSIGIKGVEPAYRMTVLDVLQKAHELGVKVVQVGPNLPLDRLTQQEFDTVLQKAREWEIELELGTCGLEYRHLVRWISLADRAGARLLRTTPESAEGEVPSSSAMKRDLGAIIPELATRSVRLALENYKLPTKLLAGTLAELHSPWLGATLDTVNSMGVPEGIEHVVRTLAPHTFCLHIKEFVVRRMWHMLGFTVEGAPVGKGQLDLPWLLETLRAAGVSPNAILEVWVPQQKTLEETIALEQAWVIESINFLRRYIPD